MATATQDNKAMREGGMNGDERWWQLLRVVGWSMAALLLLLPLVAMVFTEEVDWGPEDFLFAAILLGGSGLLCELAIRRSNDNAYRIGVLLALAAAFLLIWSNAAVGFVGSGSNTANVLYFALLAVPVLGGIVSRFTARGMFVTMILTAVAQAAITLFAYAADLVGEDERIAILAINAIFILMWTASALLFHQAAAHHVSLVVGSQESFERMRWSRIHFVLSSLMSAIGAVLLFLMVTMENELGAVPLFVLILGIGWFCITLFRAKASHQK